MLQNVNARFSGEIPDGLKYAVTTANSIELAKFFNRTLMVEILGVDNVFNATQAEQALRRFYTLNSVAKIAILYEGGKGQSQYLIAKIISSNGIFRLSILVKSQLIIQLNIEKENES